MNNLSPDMLAYLEQERLFNESRSGTRIRRVKIERPGQAWLVRFLPVALGKSGVFYVRNAQHWLNKTPITCPRNVSPDFGGDPEAACPVCDLSDELNAEQHEEISDFGWKLRASAQWLTYCLVLEIDPGRGEPQVLPMSEVMKPWEFALYKTTFDELCDYFRRGRTKDRPLSVLDLKLGNDFWATKTNKGIRLDRGDATPIFDIGPNFDKQVDAVFAAIAPPTIKLPSQRDLEVFARKARAAAFGDDAAEVPAPIREHSRGRGGRDAETEEDFGRRGRRPAAIAPEEAEAEANTDSSTADDDAPVDALRAEAEDDAVDQIPGAEVPSRASSRKPARAGGRHVSEIRDDQIPGAEVPSRASSKTAPPPLPAATGARRMTAVAPAASAPARAGVRRMSEAPAAVAETVNDEEDEGIAEEASDMAAVASAPLPEQGGSPAARGTLRQKLVERLRQAKQ